MDAANREIVAAHAIGATIDRFEDIYTQVLGREAVPARRAA
jgi:phosphatidylinositol alpha 1,6-mannosyltransferase